MNEIDNCFAAAEKNLNVNTAYPVYKNLFQKYRKCDFDLFRHTTDISFYIHVPFCRQFCSFCEYTKFLSGDEEGESHYVDMVERQMDEFLTAHPDIDMLYGFDIGGGTPTALSERNLTRLLKLQKSVEDRFKKNGDFQKSIEISFSTMTDEKLRKISDYGFERISAGIQSADKKIMQHLGRFYTEIESIVRVREKIRKSGIRKFNIDLMYGLPGQDERTLKETIRAISLIRPEQITVYETRYNNNHLSSGTLTREEQYEQYCMLYQAITELGYTGRFGQNTFDIDGDIGVSSYLKYRMEECISYRGFGVSAQSMSMEGLSYGACKNLKQTKMPEMERIEDGVIYHLPKEEIAAKYVSIALYGGSFRLDILGRILDESPFTFYKEELDYIFGNDYVYKEGNEVILTKKGFRHYAAVGALFWSKEQRRRLTEGE